MTPKEQERAGYSDSDCAKIILDWARYLDDEPEPDVRAAQGVIIALAPRVAEAYLRSVDGCTL